ncbi:MAG: sulfhydrogenase subunit delta [Chromatiales bacterium]|jgi:coenzyme F420-reducing hydrogenase gamma subunit
MNAQTKPTVAVHKFSSCDGCQLAFLNLGEALLELAQLVDIRHFVEAGVVDPETKVDVAFIEGSISTPGEVERIRKIRDNSRFLIAIGACACAGGLQALRNLDSSSREWRRAVYARPEYIDSLDTSTSVPDHVRVDLELWGCPVTSRQVLAATRSLLFGVSPLQDRDKVCLECKRQGNVCLLVSRGEPCMGPVTRTGCGALCPAFGRDCYGCFGPTEADNGTALARRLQGLGLSPDRVAQRFLFINSHAPQNRELGLRWRRGDGC